MKKPIALALVLSGLAGFLAPRAEASCAFLRGPRHIEAEVVTCEAPRARAEREFGKHRMTYPQSGEPPASVLENILKSAPPSQVVSLKVIRFQQLPKDAEGAQEDLAGVPWTAEEKPEMQEYLVTGVASCAELPPGEKATSSNGSPAATPCRTRTSSAWSGCRCWCRPRPQGPDRGRGHLRGSIRSTTSPSLRSSSHCATEARNDSKSARCSWRIR